MEELRELDRRTATWSRIERPRRQYPAPATGLSQAISFAPFAWSGDLLCLQGSIIRKLCFSLKVSFDKPWRISCLVISIPSSESNSLPAAHILPNACMGFPIIIWRFFHPLVDPLPQTPPRLNNTNTRKSFDTPPDFGLQRVALGTAFIAA